MLILHRYKLKKKKRQQTTPNCRGDSEHKYRKESLLIYLQFWGASVKVTGDAYFIRISSYPSVLFSCSSAVNSQIRSCIASLVVPKWW